MWNHVHWSRWTILTVQLYTSTGCLCKATQASTFEVWTWLLPFILQRLRYCSTKALTGKDGKGKDFWWVSEGEKRLNGSPWVSCFSPSSLMFMALMEGLGLEAPLMWRHYWADGPWTQHCVPAPTKIKWRLAYCILPYHVWCFFIRVSGVFCSCSFG